LLGNKFVGEKRLTVNEFWARLIFGTELGHLYCFDYIFSSFLGGPFSQLFALYLDAL
jgi:hypothetical protein